FSSRRRHTRSDRDRSSDVCSSDLLEQVARREMRSERVGPADGRGEMRAPEARSEDPHRNVESLAGYRAHALPLARRREVRHELRDRKSVVRERVEISVVAVSLKKK